MSKYQSVINNQGGEFYALVARVDKSGEMVIAHGYKGRFFNTHEAAEKSTAKYIAKI